MMTGTYIGPKEALRGKTALLRCHSTYSNHVLAQFDDMELTHPDTGVRLGFDWHIFPIHHFETAQQEFLYEFTEKESQENRW